ncbi:MFS transporter [Methyloceanibacter sp.]|jgi:EmrB/QacA subfamily drug resistance transporter|uniref:MFS transporter n=1 Tax=Methyloceanibacter sp. TaxID=1965321 RepID=UPI003563C36D
MADDDEKLSKSTILGMVAMAVAVFVVANDFTALSVALPAIEKTFGTSVNTSQWVINGYAMVFGVAIVTGGRLADIFGRRRIFFIGSTIFAGFSVLGGFAPNIWMLLACRFLMGIGGAMMWPAILGMTFSLMPRNKAGLAGGLIMGSAGFGNAFGPLLGGVLTDTVGWQWVFFLNLPIALAGVLITYLVVPRDEDRKDHEGIDYLGMAVLTIGLFAMLLALDLGTRMGWDSPIIIGLFAMSGVALAKFFFVERRAGDSALVPDDVMGNLSFTAACLTVLMMSAIFFAALLYLPQFMSKVLKFSAIESGAGLLPMMGTFALTSFISGRLYAKLGSKVSVTGGALFLAAGMFLLSRISPTTTYDDLILGMVVLGIGVGLFYSSITTAGITALDPSRSSLAGAIVYMFQIAGGSIGLGANTAIVLSASNMAEGIHIAFLADAILAVCGAVISLLFVGGTLDTKKIKAAWHHSHRAHA